MKVLVRLPHPGVNGFMKVPKSEAGKIQNSYTEIADQEIIQTGFEILITVSSDPLSVTA